MAERFLTQAKASFTELSRQPRMGAPLKLRNAQLVKIRTWRVTGFDNHLVFLRIAL
jgi:hypothetical protein